MLSRGLERKCIRIRLVGDIRAALDAKLVMHPRAGTLDEGRPESAARTFKRIARGIPIVELTEHSYMLRVRRPDGEPGPTFNRMRAKTLIAVEIGRASCREMVKDCGAG